MNKYLFSTLGLLFFFASCQKEEYLVEAINTPHQPTASLTIKHERDKKNNGPSIWTALASSSDSAVLMLKTRLGNFWNLADMLPRQEIKKILGEYDQVMIGDTLYISVISPDDPYHRKMLRWATFERTEVQ